MKKLAVALLLPCVFAASSCSALRWLSEKPVDTANCAGWNKIRIKPETAMYLAKNDFAAGIDIDSHNLNGQNKGCWK